MRRQEEIIGLAPSVEQGIPKDDQITEIHRGAKPRPGCTGLSHAPGWRTGKLLILRSLCTASAIASTMQSTCASVLPRPRPKRMLPRVASSSRPSPRRT